MLNKIILAFVVSCVLAACSIHPLPEDVTGVSTTMIVRKIRCEAREAVIKKALDYLRSEGFAIDKARLETMDIRKDNFNNRTVSGALYYFSQTGIVFNFTLQGTENNGLALTGDLVRPLKHETETLNGTIGNSLQRDNIRSFTVTDNFLELVQTVKDSYCDVAPSTPNYEYPMVGRIGIDEMVATFVDMTLFNGLGNKSDAITSGGSAPGASAKPGDRGPPTMVDTITFTTTIGGGLTPKVVFTPIGKALQLLDATLAGTATRTDKHAVIVGLAIPTKPTFNLPSASSSSQNLTTSFVTATTNPNSGEAAAVKAVDQQIQRFEVSKPIIVAP